jgi:hypothetical protein
MFFPSYLEKENGLPKVSLGPGILPFYALRAASPETALWPFRLN